jgi:hypothetical protein
VASMVLPTPGGPTNNTLEANPAKLHRQQSGIAIPFRI